MELAQQIVELQLDRARVAVVQLEHGAHVVRDGEPPENRRFLRQVAQAAARRRWIGMCVSRSPLR